MTRSAPSPHDSHDSHDPYGQHRLGPAPDEATAPARPDPDAGPAIEHDDDHSYTWDVAEGSADGGEDSALSARPEHPATPAVHSAGEHGGSGDGWAGTPVAASSMTPYDPTPPGGMPVSGRRKRAWLIAGIGILVALLLLGGCTALVIGGVRSMAGIAAPDPGDMDPGMDDWGTVTVLDADGNDVTGTVGDYDRPAIVGQHTVLFTTYQNGELTLDPASIELDATLPLADGADVIDPDYQLVILTVTVANTGTVPVLLRDEMSLDASTDLNYHPDVAAGLVPEALADAETMEPGEEIQVHSAFLVRTGEVDSLQFLIQPYSADTVTLEAP